MGAEKFVKLGEETLRQTIVDFFNEKQILADEIEVEVTKFQHWLNSQSRKGEIKRLLDYKREYVEAENTDSAKALSTLLYDLVPMTRRILNEYWNWGRRIS